MILGQGTPQDVDAFMAKDSCERTKAAARDVLDKAIAQNENAEIRRIKFVGCDAPTEIPVPDIAEVKSYR